VPFFILLAFELGRLLGVFICGFVFVSGYKGGFFVAGPLNVSVNSASTSGRLLCSFSNLRRLR
jgi:hypothetical protein